MIMNRLFFIFLILSINYNVIASECNSINALDINYIKHSDCISSINDINDKYVKASTYLANGDNENAIRQIEELSEYDGLHQPSEMVTALTILSLARKNKGYIKKIELLLSGAKDIGLKEESYYLQRILAAELIMANDYKDTFEKRVDYQDAFKWSQKAYEEDKDDYYNQMLYALSISSLILVGDEALTDLSKITSIFDIGLPNTSPLHVIKAIDDYRNGLSFDSKKIANDILKKSRSYKTYRAIDDALEYNIQILLNIEDRNYCYRPDLVASLLRLIRDDEDENDLVRVYRASRELVEMGYVDDEIFERFYRLSQLYDLNDENIATYLTYIPNIKNEELKKTIVGSIRDLLSKKGYSVHQIQLVLEGAELRQYDSKNVLSDFARSEHVETEHFKLVLTGKYIDEYLKHFIRAYSEIVDPALMAPATILPGICEAGNNKPSVNNFYKTSFPDPNESYDSVTSDKFKYHFKNKISQYADLAESNTLSDDKEEISADSIYESIYLSSLKHTLDRSDSFVIPQFQTLYTQRKIQRYVPEPQVKNTCESYAYHSAVFKLGDKCKTSSTGKRKRVDINADAVEIMFTLPRSEEIEKTIRTIKNITYSGVGASSVKNSSDVVILSDSRSELRSYGYELVSSDKVKGNVEFDVIDNDDNSCPTWKESNKKMMEADYIELVNNKYLDVGYKNNKYQIKRYEDYADEAIGDLYRIAGKGTTDKDIEIIIVDRFPTNSIDGEINHNGMYEPTHPDLSSNNLTMLLWDKTVNKEKESADKTSRCLRPYKQSENKEGHGIHMSGIIHASLDGVGVVGIVSDANVKHMPAKKDSISVVVSETGSDPTIDDVLNAIGVVQSELAIVNASFDHSDLDPNTIEVSEETILEARESVLVVAASSDDTVNTSRGCNGWPACFGNVLPNVISVGSLGKQPWNGRRHEKSDFGDRINIYAPAFGVVSTDMKGNYSIRSGSSVATAIVSASAYSIAAGYDKKIPAYALKQLLVSRADYEFLYIPKFKDDDFNGVLNLEASKNYIEGDYVVLNDDDMLCKSSYVVENDDIEGYCLLKGDVILKTKRQRHKYIPYYDDKNNPIPKGNVVFDDLLRMINHKDGSISFIQKEKYKDYFNPYTPNKSKKISLSKHPYKWMRSNGGIKQMSCLSDDGDNNCFAIIHKDGTTSDLVFKNIRDIYFSL